MGAVRRNVILVLGILGFTTIPLVASARHLQPMDGESSPAPPVTTTPPNTAPSPPPTVIMVDADPWATSSEMRALVRPVRKRPRPLDAMDPWADETKRATAHAHSGHAALDKTDPWAASNVTPRPNALHTTPTPSPQQTADDALRQAIKAAVDAGDLDRAAKLIEVLRGAKR